MILTHLPKGPTATFKITSILPNAKIVNHGNPTEQFPEVILNNFDTKLGHRIGRMLSAIFPQRPEFTGRRVVTFHNQRDFIFVRHHRYIFTEDGKRANLQELGPRFTMKLLSLQRGTFDTTLGEYEWIHRADMNVSRKRFYL
jgi:ribosome production factor 1